MADGQRPKRVLLVCSSGGHLLQLLRAAEVMEGHDKAWVTFNKPDARHFLSAERTYWCFHPTTRNFKNLIKNTFQSIKILRRERPDVIVSSGAGVAIPYFIFGWILRKKLVFIEAFNRVDQRSLTGVFTYPLADLFCVQWEQLAAKHQRAVFIGRLP